jgi:hypothetical protein
MPRQAAAAQDCIVPGCRREGRNRLGVRCRIWHRRPTLFPKKGNGRHLRARCGGVPLRWPCIGRRSHHAALRAGRIEEDHDQSNRGYYGRREDDTN